MDKNSIRPLAPVIIALGEAGKDKRWLESRLGLPEDWEKRGRDGIPNITYNEIRDILSKAGILFQATSGDCRLSPESNPTLFLKTLERSRDMRQAAGVSASTVNRWLDEKDIPMRQLVGLETVPGFGLEYHFHGQGLNNLVLTTTADDPRGMDISPEEEDSGKRRNETVIGNMMAASGYGRYTAMALELDNINQDVAIPEELEKAKEIRSRIDKALDKAERDGRLGWLFEVISRLGLNRTFMAILRHNASNMLSEIDRCLDRMTRNALPFGIKVTSNLDNPPIYADRMVNHAKAYGRLDITFNDTTQGKAVRVSIAPDDYQTDIRDIDPADAEKYGDPADESGKTAAMDDRTREQLTLVNENLIREKMDNGMSETDAYAMLIGLPKRKLIEELIPEDTMSAARERLEELKRKASELASSIEYGWLFSLLRDEGADDMSVLRLLGHPDPFNRHSKTVGSGGHNYQVTNLLDLIPALRRDGKSLRIEYCFKSGSDVLKSLRSKRNSLEAARKPTFPLDVIIDDNVFPAEKTYIQELAAKLQRTVSVILSRGNGDRNDIRWDFRPDADKSGMVTSKVDWKDLREAWFHLPTDLKARGNVRLAEVIRTADVSFEKKDGTMIINVFVTTKKVMNWIKENKLAEMKSIVRNTYGAENVTLRIFAKKTGDMEERQETKTGTKDTPPVTKETPVHEEIPITGNNAGTADLKPENDTPAVMTDEPVGGDGKESPEEPGFFEESLRLFPLETREPTEEENTGNGDGTDYPEIPEETPEMTDPEKEEEETDNEAEPQEAPKNQPKTPDTDRSDTPKRLSEWLERQPEYPEFKARAADAGLDDGDIDASDEDLVSSVAEFHGDEGARLLALSLRLRKAFADREVGSIPDGRTPAKNRVNIESNRPAEAAAELLSEVTGKDLDTLPPLTIKDGLVTTTDGGKVTEVSFGDGSVTLGISQKRLFGSKTIPLTIGTGDLPESAGSLPSAGWYRLIDLVREHIRENVTEALKRAREASAAEIGDSLDALDKAMRELSDSLKSVIAAYPDAVKDIRIKSESGDDWTNLRIEDGGIMMDRVITIGTGDNTAVPPRLTRIARAVREWLSESPED